MGTYCPCRASVSAAGLSIGVVEGFKEEQASLREALDRKEMAEQGLVAELEGLQGRLQQEAQRAAALLEENATLLSQREMVAAAAQDREEGEDWSTQGSGEGA